jgi:hypothetical protein
MNGCQKKKSLNFSWHQKRLGGFVFYKVKLMWRRVKTTKKDEEEEEKVEEW